MSRHKCLYRRDFLPYQQPSPPLPLPQNSLPEPLLICNLVMQGQALSKSRQKVCLGQRQARVPQGSSTRENSLWCVERAEVKRRWTDHRVTQDYTEHAEALPEPLSSLRKQHGPQVRTELLSWTKTKPKQKNKTWQITENTQHEKHSWNFHSLVIYYFGVTQAGRELLILLLQSLRSLSPLALECSLSGRHLLTVDLIT